MSLARPVEIVRVIRRMRGGSQSFLVQGSDGGHYVAKFQDNPQGTRTLVNEWIAGHLLNALNVATPAVSILSLDRCCVGRQHLYFSKLVPESISDGLHFGSRVPVDPERVAIFDMLPRLLYEKIGNVEDLGVIFAFDLWAANVDARQFIFARGRRSNRTNKPASNRPKSLLTAWAIDHGMCFSKHWNLLPMSDYAPARLDIYARYNFVEDAVRGAELIQALPDSVFQSACAGVPEQWLDSGDQARLTGLMDKLKARRCEMSTLIQKAASGVR